jgi:(p)ppGpp synthase/HD superfamily hydrolase
MFDKLTMDKGEWAIEQHRLTNHMYDEYLPYSFHLRMVAQVAEDFKQLLDYRKDYTTGNDVRHNDDYISLQQVCLLAVWGHDLIEDARINYNKCVEVFGVEVANIIYAVSNEKGKDRSERANDKNYKGIRAIKGADFVKLCDRIANVQYSKLTKSRQYIMYKKENDNFMVQLGWTGSPTHKYADMFNYLIKLFED